MEELVINYIINTTTMKLKDLNELLKDIDWETDITIRWIEIAGVSKITNMEWELINLMLDKDWVIIDKQSVVQEIL